jgi:23S rRNA (cytosine1962-C5)-methyltransferase
MLVITIKQGKEKSLLERDPWIYVSAVERVDGKPGERNNPGATAVVQTSSGQFLARAAHSPNAQLRARVWSFDPNEAIDHGFIKRRVKAAIAKRTAKKARAGAPAPGVPIKLIVGDEDGLSGLLVEWFTAAPGYLVCQFGSTGVDAWKVAIVQALIAETGCRNVYERADEVVRRGELLPVVSGPLAGDEPPEDIQVTIKGVRYAMNIKTAQSIKFK